MDYEECDECEGEGVVFDEETGEWIECPECDGEGVIYFDDDDFEE